MTHFSIQLSDISFLFNYHDQVRSNRSAFITLFQADAKS